ncbi:hypothetical protein O3P69_020872 [Scylla paramamosain]|uniref:Uncharacterized protein n=1 Tax=Scylla paramamosain TaxID=85552 RepID=A0AAW0TP05_SCYPA
MEKKETASSSIISEDMEAEDCYSSIFDEEDDNGDHHRSTNSKALQIVKVWLQNKGKERLTDPTFNNEKVPINLLFRYNTAMPSNAAEECLFSLDLPDRVCRGRVGRAGRYYSYSWCGNEGLFTEARSPAPKRSSRITKGQPSFRFGY